MLPRGLSDFLEACENQVGEAAREIRSALFRRTQPLQEPLEVLSCCPHQAPVIV